jgi:hypothetical protein
MTDKETLKMALDALEKLFGIPDKWTGEGGGDVAVWRLGGSYRAQQAITALKERLAQPEQEPVVCRFCRDERGCWAWQCNNCGEIDDSQEPAPPQRTEQNFCSRCGKRTPDLITIHTCTPPKEKNNV